MALWTKQIGFDDATDIYNIELDHHMTFFPDEGTEVFMQREQERIDLATTHLFTKAVNLKPPTTEEFDIDIAKVLSNERAKELQHEEATKAKLRVYIADLKKHWEQPEKYDLPPIVKPIQTISANEDVMDPQFPLILQGNMVRSLIQNPPIGADVKGAIEDFEKKLSSKERK